MKPIWRNLSILLLYLLCSNNIAGKEILEQKIDVQFHQILLKDALMIVAEKGHFEWSYNAKIIQGNKKVTLVANDWTIRETLHALLGEGYQFKSNGNYIVLKKSRRSDSDTYGYIKDGRTGERIVGATVFDKKTLRATTTDSNGYYRLKMKKRIETDLVVAKLGFRDTVLQITSQTPRYLKLDLVEIPLDTARQKRTLKTEWGKVNREATKFFNATLEKWHELNLRDSVQRGWQVSLLPKIGSNHTLSGKVSNDWSLNVLAGNARGVEILEVGGLANFTQEYMRGVQIAGLFNQNNGATEGVQIAGLYNVTSTRLEGFQIGGLANLARQSDGIGQISGIANLAPKGNLALQIGGISNTTQSVEYLQVAGIYNRAQTVGSLQVSGLVNLADSVGIMQVTGILNRAKTVGGLQISGLINEADSVGILQVAGVFNRANSVTGVQVSGILNHAKKLRGIQFGLINATSDCTCMQFGLLNRVGRRWLPFFNAGISRSGRKKAGDE